MQIWLKRSVFYYVFKVFITFRLDTKTFVLYTTPSKESVIVFLQSRKMSLKKNVNIEIL